ncbi:isochorismate synthase [Prochlorococcus marinus]|uniref:isochorismate synthase n=1 Tax=Prochlorococcus marinus (strain MIT 9211) TaxID=93059 RepID=A9BD38_PROM4|nr:isochorismate synthase [Prochlorococcus marinus]ABX08126.1 Isochorismate synthase [Prochlorococcus marinus str. MIT 9211]
MKCGPTFSEFLQASLRAWALRRIEDCVLSLALPLESVDPLTQLPVIADRHHFSFLWDSSPGLTLAAAGKCQNFELVGQRRFELAQRFSDETLNRLIDGTPEAPSHAKPRVLLAFTFFEQTTEIKIGTKNIPAVQAILPSWQLTRQTGQSWLRLNAVVAHEADVRDFVEQLWLMREKLVTSSKQVWLTSINMLGVSISQNWQNNYRLALAKGIDLVNSGELKKLVLAVKESIVLKEPLNPLVVLSNLRIRQQGSCRFLWKRASDESFFGASPERLLSCRNGLIRTDALAGTASKDDDGYDLLRSDKDLREHELVVSSIHNQMIQQGLEPYRSRSPRLAKHGHLVHLHTPITAMNKGLSPLQLADALHPTPAVAGLPRPKAFKWLRTLESFDRGNYAAPIGWIDNLGNAEFRVAIRCAYARGTSLELIAGAGLVKGSVVEKELQEVKLKLGVMADHVSSESLTKLVK